MKDSLRQPTHHSTTPRKVPQRTCVACRQGNERRALLRFVRDSGERVCLDEGGRAPGRGAYVCADEACLDKARKTRALERALRVGLTEEDHARLAAEFADVMSRRIIEEQ